jgi:hypothetical protein
MTYAAAEVRIHRLDPGENPSGPINKSRAAPETFRSKTSSRLILFRYCNWGTVACSSRKPIGNISFEKNARGA